MIAIIYNDEMCTREPHPPPIRPPINTQYCYKYYCLIHHKTMSLTANRNSVIKP